jgi:hypothetical protein
MNRDGYGTRSRSVRNLFANEINVNRRVDSIRVCRFGDSHSDKVSEVIMA